LYSCRDCTIARVKVAQWKARVERGQPAAAQPDIAPKHPRRSGREKALVRCRCHALVFATKRMEHLLSMHETSDEALLETMFSSPLLEAEE